MIFKFTKFLTRFCVSVLKTIILNIVKINLLSNGKIDLDILSELNNWILIIILKLQKTTLKNIDASAVSLSVKLRITAFHGNGIAMVILIAKMDQMKRIVVSFEFIQSSLIVLKDLTIITTF